MAITNQERVGKALVLLREGLKPFVERELRSHFREAWEAQVTAMLSDTRLGGKNREDSLLDPAAQLVIIDRQWGAIFNRVLGKAERSLVNELLDIRNRWAHLKPFSGDDTYRAFDSTARLLTAVSAPEAEVVEQMKAEALRVRFEEQVRGEKRKSGGSLIEPTGSSSLKPWREVVTPHADVASGRYQQAEFAADLWQVHLGEGSDEYRQPKEFFRRTYLTESLSRLLVGAIERLCGRGGDPVVQLQTNFGGGKTHSMLALYHLCSGAQAADLPGVEELLADSGSGELPTARRAVLVGNKISPGNPVTKPDGTVVRTLWGELAWQLGGREAYERVRHDDERATNPGDVLRQLFKDYGPCLVLIDEWVAYARQLHDQSDLPAGGFETQFSFAQALTESAKLAGNCLLVISLPASDTSGSPHAVVDDVEVGGIRGREALDRLRNVVGRVEASWRPATAEEGFEIVRRRLFEPLPGDKFKHRDVTARAFAELYRSQEAEFPPEAYGADYERRIQAAYPIHPEIFDQLYGTWSTLVKFQRTRGVLRLMASVIHALWRNGDQNPLILPSMVPIDDASVRFELTRYLSDQWDPIITRDVDGTGSLPLVIDGENPNLGKLSATRRVARTIYLGSAPTASAAHRGIEDRKIKLGCAMPGEAPATYGDALRRLANRATYLYQDGQRYWYSTQPTVTKLAEDRAEQLKREPDKVTDELERRARADLQRRGDFDRIHAFPRSGGDVADVPEARLVVLPVEHGYSKEASSPAEQAAAAILESRGSSPRLYRNTLVFLVADRTRVQDLHEAVRKVLAWDSILAEKNALNLDPHQVRQAETQRQAADGTVTARLPETFNWVLVPGQRTPQSPIEWKATRLSGGEALALRAERRLRADEDLLQSIGATILRKHLDDVPLWRDNHVVIRQLVEYFACYLYLPRVARPDVLTQAISNGLSLAAWAQDTFAYAESWDEANGRYRGLRAGAAIPVSADSTALLVEPRAAQAQLEAEARERAAAAAAVIGPTPPLPPSDPGDTHPPTTPPPPVQQLPKRFYGTVELDSTRVGRDAGRIAEEVIAHLVGQLGAEVTVTLEIQARLPSGAGDQLVRTVSENSKTLKFRSFGFERE